VLDRLGLTVNRLIRISFGPFQLLDLEPGTVEPVRRRNLIDQLGPKVSAELALTDDEDAPGRAKWAKPKAAARPPAKAPSKFPGRSPTKAPTKAKAGS
jgi:23S rRNA pseudouridine2605 synthase